MRIQLRSYPPEVIPRESQSFRFLERRPLCGVGAHKLPARSTRSPEDEIRLYTAPDNEMRGEKHPFVLCKNQKRSASRRRNPERFLIVLARMQAESVARRSFLHKHVELSEPCGKIHRFYHFG